MEKLYQRHLQYISSVPMEYCRQIEYGGLKTGDFRIDGDIVIEVGGEDKGYRQIKRESKGFIAADNIELAAFKKIPLWAFGCLY